MDYVRKLMPLRIPSCWSVRHNGFMEGEDPCARFVESEDIIWMEQCDMSTGGSTGIFLDLGWYGSREAGEFVLCCFERDRDHLIRRFASRDRLEIAYVLEQWLITPDPLIGVKTS